jgi:hypothetical protein
VLVQVFGNDLRLRKRIVAVNSAAGGERGKSEKNISLAGNGNSYRRQKGEQRDCSRCCAWQVLR